MEKMTENWALQGLWDYLRAVRLQAAYLHFREILRRQEQEPQRYLRAGLQRARECWRWLCASLDLEKQLQSLMAVYISMQKRDLVNAQAFIQSGATGFRLSLAIFHFSACLLFQFYIFCRREARLPSL